MRIPAVMLLGLGLMVGTACSAPDPGVGGFGPPRKSSVGGDTTGTGTGTDTGTGGNTGTTTGGGDGGTAQQSKDAGGGGAPDSGGGGAKVAGVDSGPANAFSGAPAFASKPIATAGSAKTAHLNAGQGVVPGKATACLDCHKTGGGGVAFLSGGTVFTDTAGNTPAADYEVRIIDAKGAAFSAHTDEDGNFRIDPPIAGTTGPYMTGARNAATVTLMVTHPADNNCNSSNCHGGAQGPIHVP